MTNKRTAREFWIEIKSWYRKQATLHYAQPDSRHAIHVREVLPDEISDTERLDYLIPRINGSVYRNIGVLYSDTSQVREAIDAAIREGEKK